jgi:hypothetical protein
VDLPLRLAEGIDPFAFRHLVIDPAAGVRIHAARGKKET